MVNADFYRSLPKPEFVRNFRVPYYTEALKLYNGVRVVPDETFVESLDPHTLSFFKTVGLPCYFIPIFNGNLCYGFVLKGQGKPTPSYSTWVHSPGIERIQDGDTVWIVEGIKDTFLPLSLGLISIPMLTSGISDVLLTYLKQKHCKVVFVPDHDEYQDSNAARFFKKVEPYTRSIPGEDTKPLQVTWVRLEGNFKDLGDFFLPECRSEVLEAFKNAYRSVKIWRDSL